MLPSMHTFRFGQRLRAARAYRGLTRAQLAARSGVPLTTIRQIERGASLRPRFTTVAALADALDVAPSDLMWTDTPVSEPT
jgi:transcriptional regulator with XRE-family HTH domain